MKDTVCFSNQNCCHPCIFLPHSHTIINIQRNCCCILQQHSQNWICKLTKLKQYSISTFFLGPIEVTHTEKLPAVFWIFSNLHRGSGCTGVKNGWRLDQPLLQDEATERSYLNRKKAVIICLYFTSSEVNLQKMYNALACLFDVQRCLSIAITYIPLAATALFSTSKYKLYPSRRCHEIKLSTPLQFYSILQKL